jgi:hypothetical protein
MLFSNPKRKLIEFTPNIEMAKDFPPIPAKFNLPSWYKEMGSNINGIKDSADFRVSTNGSIPFTIKRCVPVSDYLTSGYLIRTFSDMMISQDIKTSPVEFKWSLPSKENSSYIFGTHPFSQCPVKFNNRERHYFKIFSGWRIKTPPGYSCMFYQNFYSKDDRFSLMPGIVDTDTYDSTIAFPGYVEGDARDVKIQAGTPLVIAFPFKRDDWSMRINTEVEHDYGMNSSKKFRQYFENVYRNFFHSKKKYD